MIDLSDRIIQPSSVVKAPNGAVKWHPLRRGLQVLCGILLVALPLTNGLRLDVRRDLFYFAWHKMAAHDLYLLSWVAMLGVWLLVAVSFLYGRFWCGWVCPQTLASDFADSLKRRLEKAFRGRKSTAKVLWAGIIVALSVGTGVILADYWLNPGEVLRAALRPWTDIPASLTVYGIAAVLAADMLWVRRKFCANACPYGALIGLLADKNTMAVRYLEERESDCIKCGQCVRVCPMDIDIKQGVGQIECIGCGECADACNDVLGRRGLPGLIDFRYGTEPERTPKSLTLMQKMGLWDTQRIVIAGLVPVFALVVAWNIYGVAPLKVSANANGAITRDAQGVSNTYTVSLSNGTPRDGVYQITASGVTVMPAQIAVRSHTERSFRVTAVTHTTAMSLIGRLPLTLRVTGNGQSAQTKTIFFVPAPPKTE